MTVRVLHGDCRDVLPTLAANSVHCVVTSPPYYGLRDYGTAQWDGGDAGCDHVSRRTGGYDQAMEQQQRAAQRGYDPSSNFANYGDRWTDGSIHRSTCGKCGARRIDRQLGLEATPDEYIQTMVAVFREVRRVLRDDGTCWVNMGDSYVSHKPRENGVLHQSLGVNQHRAGFEAAQTAVDLRASGYQSKQLLMMPARLAIALQADGWWLRSDIIWAKPNPMPESVTDRPTSAHEHVFLLSKRSSYYYDADAVREPLQCEPHAPGNLKLDASRNDHDQMQKVWGLSSGRNLRNVWTIATHAFSDFHYATFPPALVERCIKAGTSERGCCAACGAPWLRQVERDLVQVRSGSQLGDGVDRNDKGSMWRSTVSGRYDTTTTGWSPSCQCDAPTQPCTVLDPFAGAGTTMLVADRLQRHAIGIELNEAYAMMARNRIVADAPLFAEVAD